MKSKAFIIIGGLVALAAATALWLERRAQMRLRAQNEAWQFQLQQHFQAAATNNANPNSQSDNASAERQYRDLLRLRGEVGVLRNQKGELDRLLEENRQLRGNLLTRVLGYETGELSPEQIESYLQKKGRSAESLLVAYRLTYDKAFLQNAIDNFPNDPKVALEAAGRRGRAGEQDRWLETFKQSDPANALANYLSAQAFLQSGQTKQALEELVAASGKSKFTDYSRDVFRSVAEAYATIGYTEAAAQSAAWSRLDQPLNDLDKLRRSLGDLANRYRQAGEEESAQSVLQMGLRLGQRLSDESLGLKTEQQELVGLQVQRKLLETMDPDRTFDNTGLTVKARLDEIARRRDEIKKLSDPPAWDGYLLRTLSEPDLLSYFERLRNSGEAEARRWAATRQAGH